MNSIIAVANGMKGNMEKGMGYTRKNMDFIKSLPYSTELSASYNHIILYLSYNVRDLKAAWEWSEEYDRKCLFEKG
jgi:hypothetical protein